MGMAHSTHATHAMAGSRFLGEATLPRVTGLPLLGRLVKLCRACVVLTRRVQRALAWLSSATSHCDKKAAFSLVSRFRLLS